MGALFDFFLVSGHLARRAVELLSFLGIFVSLVLFSSLLAFGPLALRRKGGIVVDWCSGRTKSSASSEGGHPSPSQSPSAAVPPLFAKARGWGSLFSV